MTITRVGTNQKYAEGWDTVFSGKKGGGNAAGAGAAKKAGAVAKKPAAKKALKKAKK